MAIQLANIFTEFEFTPEEQIESEILNYLQRMRLQTELTEVSRNLLGLKFDATNVAGSLQEQAFLQGRYEQIKYILERDEFAKETQRKLNEAESRGHRSES